MWNRVSMFLAFGGIFVAGFLSLSHILNVTIPCGPSHGCDIVDRHALSKWFGLPVAYYGLVAYLALALLSIVRLSPDVDLRRAAIRFGMFISGVGSLVSFYLIYTSLVIIQATCYWCLASAAIMCLLFLSHAFLAQAEDIGSGSIRSEKWPLVIAVLLCAGGLSSRVWNLHDIATNAVTKIDWSRDYKTIEDLIPKDNPH